MRNKSILVVVVCVMFVANTASADTFGTGANQFTIDFVNISGDASSANGTKISQGSRYKTFIDPGDYRMGTYEITNDQWGKFTNIYGTPTGSPPSAYNSSSYYTGTNIPTNRISWYEGAHFANYLNTSTGYQAAYKFTGTQGTTDYTFAVWESGDAGYDVSNPYRNSDAFYFLPTDDEWVKAAYWNGTSLQTYATKPGDTLYQGNGSNGGWNYYYAGEDGPAGPDNGPWDVGSGSEELNGTFDMMGNVKEWIESPLYSGDYLSDSTRVLRGGTYNLTDIYLGLTNPSPDTPNTEQIEMGFRVASVPEPATLLLLGLGGLMIRKKR